MEIKTQIERKFIVRGLPDLTDFKKEEIQQWYTTKPGEDESIRIRKYSDDRCYVDIIHGQGKIRKKYGRKSNWDKFKDKDLSHLPTIRKTRYKKQYDNVLMCVDIFEDGLQLVEIESYDSEFSIDRFVIPEWFGKEVTEEIEYTNNWLAYL